MSEHTKAADAAAHDAHEEDVEAASGRAMAALDRIIEAGTTGRALGKLVRTIGAELEPLTAMERHYVVRWLERLAVAKFQDWRCGNPRSVDEKDALRAPIWSIANCERVWASLVEKDDAVLAELLRDDADRWIQALTAVDDELEKEPAAAEAPA